MDRHHGRVVAPAPLSNDRVPLVACHQSLQPPTPEPSGEAGGGSNFLSAGLTATISGPQCVVLIPAEEM